MINIIDTDKDLIYFIGDIHGEFKAIGNWIKQKELKDCAIIFCGDFGLGFEKPGAENNELSKSDKTCIEHNVDCYAIRGNHDDPSYFNTTSQKLILSRIQTVSDYTVIRTPQHNIMCLGGAVSVDRSERVNRFELEVRETMLTRRLCRAKAEEKCRKTWWEGEEFFYDEESFDKLKELGINIDTVASHSAPDFCQPLTKPSSIGWTMYDDNLEEDLKQERELLTKAFNRLKEDGHNVTNWFYGHFHKHYSDTIEGTRFTGLNMGRNSKMGSYVGGYFDMAELI